MQSYANIITVSLTKKKKTMVSNDQKMKQESSSLKC